MSPAGGVGINLAIQDAVAVANLLAKKLRRGPVSIVDLRQVQRRREWPAALISIFKPIFIGMSLPGDKPPVPFRCRLSRAC